MVRNKRKVRMVRQRNLADCGICCLAMATRVSYSLAVSAFGHTGYGERRKPLGTLDAEVVAAAWHLTHELWPTVTPIEHLGKPAFREKKGYKARMFSQVEIRMLLMRWPAILTVSSLNFDGVLHYIYWEDEKIYDPSRRKCYQDLPEVIESAILIEPRKW